jgi:hypothetical protein
LALGQLQTRPGLTDTERYDPEANLLGGARLFANILKSHPLSEAAARHNGGWKYWSGKKAQNYQKDFNWKSAAFQNSSIACTDWGRVPV